MSGVAGCWRGRHDRDGNFVRFESTRHNMLDVVHVGGKRPWRVAWRGNYTRNTRGGRITYKTADAAARAADRLYP